VVVDTNTVMIVVAETILIEEETVNVESIVPTIVVEAVMKVREEVECPNFSNLFLPDFVLLPSI
jgi:hypothetical protein